MKKSLKVANGLALVITIGINYLSNTGVFNGNTMASVSAEYANFFTPAGYAFSIWGVIYLGLAAFVLYQAGILTNKNSSKSASKIEWWFVISCAANCCWVFAWLYELTGLSVLIMFVLLYSLIKIIIKTNMELHDADFKEVVFVWWPFSLYSGWISVALIANIAAYLSKTKWDAWGIPPTGWSITMVFLAGAINLFMTWNRNMREFALVGVWALLAIAVANWEDEQTIARSAIVVAAILFISSGIHLFKNRNKLPWSLNRRRN